MNQLLCWLALVPFSAIVGSVVCSVGQTCVEYASAPIAMVATCFLVFTWGFANLLSR